MIWRQTGRVKSSDFKLASFKAGCRLSLDLLLVGERHPPWAWEATRACIKNKERTAKSGWVAWSLGSLLTETRVLRYCIGIRDLQSNLKTINSTNEKAKRDGMDPCSSRGWGKCFVKTDVIRAVKEKCIGFWGLWARGLLTAGMGWLVGWRSVAMSMSEVALQQLVLWPWHRVEEKRVQMKEVRPQGVWQGLKQKLSCLLKHWTRDVSCFRPGYVRISGKWVNCLNWELPEGEGSFCFRQTPHYSTPL